MINAIFNWKGQETIIQCNIFEKMNNIFKKFSLKSGLDLNKVYFLYSGQKIEGNLSLTNIINEKDSIRNAIKILVVEMDKTIINNNLIKSKEIICPKCYSNINIKINDYKINLYGCENGHNNKIIFF